MSREAGLVRSIVVLSGPSCVGKGPLCSALEQSRPELWARLRPLVLFTSRPPRPIEKEGVDYFFRPRAAIEAMRGREGVLVVEARADLHALEVAQIEEALSRGLDPFFEGNPFVARRLIDWAAERRLRTLTVFLSPISKAEIIGLKAAGADVAEVLSEAMEHKLLRRTERQKGFVPEGELEDLRIRARSAYRELQEAWRFAHVLPNHDGEDSEHWDADPPEGDAGRAVEAFAAVLEGKASRLAESWPRSLLG